MEEELEKGEWAEEIQEILSKMVFADEIAQNVRSILR